MLNYYSGVFGGIDLSKLPTSLNIAAQQIIKHQHLDFHSSENSSQLYESIFQIAMLFKIQDFGPIGARLICCRTLQDWLSTFAKYQQTLGLPQRFINIENRHCWLVSDSALEKHAKSQNVFNFGLVLRLLKYSFGDEIPPLRYQIPRFFGQRLIEKLKSAGLDIEGIESKHVGFSLTKGLLLHPLPDANDKAAKVFERDLVRTLSLSSVKQSLVAATIDAIKRFSPANKVSQSSIAIQLGVSERTLVRRLHEDGTSFREIFNEVRNSQALSMLFQGESIETISTTQGFSERATFERAFKKWQGVTPVTMQSRFARLNNETELTDVIQHSQIPNLPGMAAKLLQMIREDEANLSELAGLVEKDPVLVVKVLNIANSGAFGHLKAQTVKAAILTILGTQKLQALVLSLITTDAFKVNQLDFDYCSFWHRALCVANFSSKLSLVLNPQQPEQKDPLYLAGLLHNIGHLVIASCLPKANKQITIESNQELSFEQLQGIQSLRLGINTLEASVLLIKLWKIPSNSSDPLAKLLQAKDAGLNEPAVEVLLKALQVYDVVEKQTLNIEECSQVKNNPLYLSEQTQLPAELCHDFYSEYQKMWEIVRSTLLD